MSLDTPCNNNETSALSNIPCPLLSYFSGVRENLTEMLVECENGVIAVTRIANMLLAIKTGSEMPLGLLRAKLRALADYLYTPLTVVSSKD